MTSSASDKCCRLTAAACGGADEMAVSCAPAAAAASAICASARRGATKNIAHHARGAQSPTHWRVAAAAAAEEDDDDDDRCGDSTGAQNDATPPRRVTEPSSHKVAAAHLTLGATREEDANLCAGASAISECQQQEGGQTARCEIFKRWRDEAASEVQDIENVVAELESEDETGADEIEEMGARLSGREATSDQEEESGQRAQSVSPRASRAQRSASPKQPAGTPTVFEEGRTGYSQQQQPMASSSRDKRPRRARTTHAASNSAAAAGASTIAPATNQNRTQTPTTTTTNFRESNNINSPIDSQLFTLTESKFNNQQRQSPGRPASAMAGSVSGGGGGSEGKQSDYWATCNLSSSSASLSKTQPPPTSTSSTSQQRVKTTRVRINSTSEQIQDPNWLIQMSRESELKQQSKRSGFPALKSLQQKLKFTIVGSSSSSTTTTTTTSSSGNASSQSRPSDLSSSATNSQQQDYPSSSSPSAANSLTLPPPVPMTPVKMPVSILKQPGTGRTPVKSAQRAKSPAIVRQQAESSAQARHPSRSTGKTSKQQLAESSNKHQQTATSKQSVAAKQTSGKKATGSVTEPSESTTKQATAAGATITTTTTEAASAKIDPAPIQPGISSAPQAVTITTTMLQTTTLTTPAAQQSGSGQQQTSNNRPVPICADGQVKVSGWKRNNLLAKTLSHFDEIRGNQRPIFMPTKITLPPEKKPSSPSGSASPQPTFPLPMSQTTHGSRGSSRSRTSELTSGTRFADIVREAILKKSLLAGGGAQTSASPPIKRASQEGRANERHQSCDLGNPASCQSAQDADGSSPAKRAVSADPGRSSVSSQSGGGGLGQPKIRKQLHSDSTGAAAQQQQQGAHSQQASPSHLKRRESGGGSRTSMAQIIAAAVAAASSEPATAAVATVQRSSFSLPSASVAASSSRAFKLQLKNEQVLQQLRRQSNEHRESLTIDLNNNNNNNSDNTSGGNLRQESSSSANEGGGGSVRLKDWKRLTSKLGLLTGRSERQMFAGAVRSSAGTPVHSSLAANPLRLTVSNQESRRLGTRSGHRGSGCGGESSPVQAEQQASRSRLLVPGGYLFDATNRRHSSQSSDVNGAAVASSSPASERKLSSSSMVVQPVSVPGFTCTGPLASRKVVATSTSGGGLKPNSGVSQRERRKTMSRSAAASPMLMAHQDSMCLRRSSDSEACGGSSRLQVVTGGAATPVTSSKKDGGAGSSSRSSMSGASVFYGGDPQGSGGMHQLTTKTRPVVVNRDDLLHLLKVTGSGVSLNVIPSDQATDDSVASLAATGEAIQHAAAGPKDNEQVHEDCSQEIAPIGSDIGAPHNDAGAQSSRNRPRGVDEQQSQACNTTKHDLSWVVKRTSKVAVFQQKLRNKMRWHSKQKQAANELEAHETKKSQVALNDDDNDDSRRMINEPNKENNSMGEPIRDDGDANPCGGDDEEEAAKNASNVVMDPTLIGDAIEMFLRTTMQQQQQQLNSSECYHDETAEQEQIELEKGERASPLDGKPAQQAPLDGTPARSVVDRNCTSDKSLQAATTCERPLDSIASTAERVKAPQPPPSITKKDGGDLRQKQKQQQQQRASIGGNNQEQQKNCSQLANKRTKTQIQAATG